MIICSYPSVRPLRKISGNHLTLRNKRLYMWPLSVGYQQQVISVNSSHGTNHRHEQQLLGYTVQRTGNNHGTPIAMHGVACSQLSSTIHWNILSQSLSWKQQILLLAIVSCLYTSHRRDGERTIRHHWRIFSPPFECCHGTISSSAKALYWYRDYKCLAEGKFLVITSPLTII